MKRLLSAGLILGAAACASTPAPAPEAAPSPPAATAPAAGAVDRPADCGRNEELLAEISRTFSVEVESIFPWVIPLTAEQIEPAEVEEDRIVVPAEGSPWAACITRNDVLWTPLAVGHDQFARRVLSIERGPDRVVFGTRSAGLTEIFH